MLDKYLHILESRPTEDHEIEQFLMSSGDVLAQIERVGMFLYGKRTFFLGDDDHISPILANEFKVKPFVYEYDMRVLLSLRSAFSTLGVKSFEIKEYDAKVPVGDELGCEAFYINPPYSSKSKGLGIRIWIERSIEACKEGATGILVMPWDGGNIDMPWVDEVQETVTEFLSKKKISILKVETNIHSYEHANSAGLMSSNIYLRLGTKSVTKNVYSSIYN